MRQIIGVLAVLLILSVIAWEDVDARANPYGYSDPYLDDINEDHPWGGEDQADDGLPSLVMPGSPGHGISRVRSYVDIFWDSFITIWFDYNTKSDPINTEVNPPVVEEPNGGRVNNNN